MMFEWAHRAGFRPLMLKQMVALVVCAAANVAVLATETLPVDVRAFIKERTQCDHLRAELPDSPDIQQMKNVSWQINKLCKGTDRHLASLKKKYSTDHSVIRVLNHLETRIEASTAN